MPRLCVEGRDRGKSRKVAFVFNISRSVPEQGCHGGSRQRAPSDILRLYTTTYLFGDVNKLLSLSNIIQRGHGPLAER